MVEPQEALQWIGAIRRGQFEDSHVEVKAAHRQLPKRIYETLSAFDREPVPGATWDDLYPERLQAYLDGVRQTRAQLWERLRMHEKTPAEQCYELGVLADENGARFMRFLEELGLVEKRGSGIRAMIAAMREARLEPPHYADTRNYFRVTLKNASLMSPEAVRWLNGFRDYRLNDNQRMALVYLHWNQKMTNSDYRRLNNVYDTIQATRELRELVSNGLVDMHASKRWAYYTLAVKTEQIIETELVADEESRILDFVRQHGSITRPTCSELLGSTPAYATYVLGHLRDHGKLQMVGRKRWARYVLP